MPASAELCALGQLESQRLKGVARELVQAGEAISVEEFAREKIRDGFDSTEQDRLVQPGFRQDDNRGVSVGACGHMGIPEAHRDAA